MNRKPAVVLTILMLLFLLVIPSVSSGEKQSGGFRTAKDHWTLLGGYGQTHRNLGDTMVRVQQVDAILQYGYFLTKEAGKSWYRVRHEVLFELPFSVVFHPDDAIMAGFNVLACWDFTASETIVPYVFAGGGFVYTNLNIPGLGSDYNGNYQGGFGMHYFINDNTTVDFNYRLHHISNASTAEPNEPLNSSKFLFGMTFFL